MSGSEMELVPVDAGLNGYLEDTIIIDWQTPSVLETARRLTKGATSPLERIGPVFEFVRDEIAHSESTSSDVLTCNASEVLREGHGLSYAKCHLFAALARCNGVPVGFGYQRLQDAKGRLVLYGFAVVYLSAEERWAILDPVAKAESAPAQFGPDSFGLLNVPDADSGEETLGQVHSKPAKRVVDTLSKAGSLARIRDALPDSLT